MPKVVLVLILLVGSATPGCRPSGLAPGSEDGSANAPVTHGAEAGARPVNVVLYLIDTLRADRLGAYGYDRPTSPNIDSLAAEGVVFERCYAAAPWTLPSVVSLMTSMFPCEHGVNLDGQRIRADVEPLAARLKTAGYANASVIANGYAGRASGLDRGFDHVELVRSTDVAHVDDLLGQIADGPFFLYVHTLEPHDPYLAPDRLVGEFGDVSVADRQGIRALTSAFRKLTRADFAAGGTPGTTDNTDEQLAVMRRLGSLSKQIDVLYAGAVRFADENLGRVIGLLKRRGVWDDTLFVLVSDHGEEMGDHGGWQHDHSVYEELVRVPMVIHFPRGEFAGRRISAVARLVDVMPTVLEYIGRPDLVRDCRGANLLPSVRGELTTETDVTRFCSVRINRKKYYRPFKESRGDVNVAMRRGRWKGIWNEESAELELYDLKADPMESRSLSLEEPEMTAQLTRDARAWLEECRAFSGAAGAVSTEALDEETRESLRALGYME